MLPSLSRGPTGPATAILPTFSLQVAHDLLDKVRIAPHQVDVVVAPPGVGKSTFMRQAIADDVGVGKLHRVLWATQSILEDSSLGGEALKDFKSLTMAAQVVYGQAAFDTRKEPGDYRAQFTWPAGPSIKIISHARLRCIYGMADPLSARLLGADLLVIDEDPLSSLLLESSTSREKQGGKLRVAELAGRGDAACAALGRVASAVSSSELASFERRDKYVQGQGLYGEPFWKLFLREHPGPVDVASLSAALQVKKPGPKPDFKLALRDAELVALSFAEDALLAAAPTPGYRNRFGLHWVGRDWSVAPSQQALFRFNLRPALRLDLPVIVLDGYAHTDQYRAMFAEHPVELHVYAPGPLLDVECSRLMHVDPVTEATSKAEQNRLQIAEELAEQRSAQKLADPGSSQLIIASQRIARPGSQWQQLLEQAYSSRGLTVARNTDTSTDVSQVHWHAGRGVNAFSGADVYALNPPSLSAMNRNYSLSALYPDNQPMRATLQAHAVGTELLQMLNRGRQPLARSSRKPRIVVGSSEAQVHILLGHLSDRVLLRAYEPILNFRKTSQNPRWRDMTAALAHELLPHFPLGLPFKLLQALPKHVGGLPAIQRKLKALARTSRSGPHLYRAFHDKSRWTYRDVPAGGSGHNRVLLDAALASVGLFPGRREHAKGRPTVYVPEGGDAELAGQAFDMWLAS